MPNVTPESKAYFVELVDLAAQSANLSAAIRKVYRNVRPPEIDAEQEVLIKTLLLASLASADKSMRKNMKEVLRQIKERREISAVNDFLAFIDADIEKNPHHIKPVDQAQMEEASKLVEGVTYTEADFE